MYIKMCSCIKKVFYLDMIVWFMEVLERVKVWEDSEKSERLGRLLMTVRHRKDLFNNHNDITNFFYVDFYPLLSCDIESCVNRLSSSYVFVHIYILLHYHSVNGNKREMRVVSRQ